MECKTLRDANITRQIEWDAGGHANNPDWRFNELAGEVGEVCNVLKKLHRERCGLPGGRASVQDLAEELADVVICMDLYMLTTAGDSVNSEDNIGHFVNLSLTHLGVQLMASLGRSAIRLVLNPNVHGTDQMPSFINLLTLLRAIAHRENIDLDRAVAQKFNATSTKVGLETKMELPERVGDARPDEPIPEGVYYDADTNSFWSFENKQMDLAFWRKWRGHNHRFPTHGQPVG